MKYLQNEARKQKSIKEVTLQFSMIFQIRLKHNTVNFRVICPLRTYTETYRHTNEFYILIHPHFPTGAAKKAIAETSRTLTFTLEMPSKTFV